MDLEELKAFLAVAETGSFSAAARSLNFAKNSLKSRIDDFEARSGVQLLSRAADQVSMTRAGELLATRGRNILKETQAVLSAARLLSNSTDFILLDLPGGLPPDIEVSAHEALRKVAPKLRWRVRYTDGCFNAETDANVMIHHGQVAPAAAHFKSQRIGKLPFRLRASAAYLEKRGVPERVEDLQEHDVMTLDAFGLNPLALPLLSGGEVPVRPTLVTQSSHLLEQLAERGDGIVLSPVSAFSRLLRAEPDLVLVLEDVIGADHQSWISARTDEESGPLGLLSAAIARLLSSVYLRRQAGVESSGL